MLPRAIIDTVSAAYAKLEYCRRQETCKIFAQILSLESSHSMSVFQLMAPFTPFFCEELYQNLKKALPEGGEGSVHWCSFPTVSASEVNVPLPDISKFQVRSPVSAILAVHCFSTCKALD